MTSIGVSSSSNVNSVCNVSNICNKTSYIVNIEYNTIRSSACVCDYVNVYRSMKRVHLRLLHEGVRFVAHRDVSERIGRTGHYKKEL